MSLVLHVCRTVGNARSRLGARRPGPVATLPATFGILAIVLAAVAPPARAQTEFAVSNLDQSGSSGTRALDVAHAQGFRTGPNLNGYDLASIQLSFSTATSQPTPLAVELWSANGTAPESRIAVLDIPDVSTTGVKTFNAPTGTTLQATTRYFVYAFYDGRLNVPSIRSFSPNGEDSGGLPGWTIDDNRYHMAGGWFSHDWSLRIAVLATPRTQPLQVTVAPVANSVTEGAAAQFRLTRSGSTAAALAVNFTVTETGAMLMASPPTSQSIQSGSASTTVLLATTDDATDENDSTVTLMLTADAAYTVGTPASAQVVVRDDDSPTDVPDDDSPTDVPDDDSPTDVPVLPVAALWLLAGLLALVGATAPARTVRGSNRT